MKYLFATLAVCAGLVAASGCKKEEPPPPAPTAPTGTNAAAAAASGVIDAATTAATQVKDQATTAAAQVKEQAATQVDAAQQQTQGLIDRAKSLIADKKYSDALASLNQLAGSKLTTDQQSLVDSLKAQIQKALAGATASDAASSLGGALGVKK